jgi:hypothetical protein
MSSSTQQLSEASRVTLSKKEEDIIEVLTVVGLFRRCCNGVTNKQLYIFEVKTMTSDSE